jgi:hypothetical protein
MPITAGGFNQTAADYPKEKTLKLFEEQVSGRRIGWPWCVGKPSSPMPTKRQRISSRIPAPGVGAERAPAYVERSAGDEIGLLGILKAGGAIFRSSLIIQKRA